ncbi:iron-sulfur cluster biosynthesis family protein [Paenibacillus cremeus]|uniref:Core domain-containing protein n=1 Tax=Paenibacillus cremeus TaxID=2163881 RepID=A0A559JMA6_9BACL|nr:iron-sulfur cluster biosynthesis family protein [Paenibacillus cremeus]TVY01011.1 hypothetical protein FPZ49_32995 [Paenibacillus cremeus]
MHITFSEEAAGRLNQALAHGEGRLVKLVFDSEGCGCAVSGVPTLWLVDEPGPNDFQLDGPPFEVWMDKKHEVYFEEKLKIDYKQADLSFVLKSSNQIYNNRMKLVDRRYSLK